jgi:hypothetical protein
LKLHTIYADLKKRSSNSLFKISASLTIFFDQKDKEIS